MVRNFEGYVKELMSKYPYVTILVDEFMYKKIYVVFYTERGIKDNIWVGEDSELFDELDVDMTISSEDEFPTDREILEMLIKKYRGENMNEFEKLLKEAKERLEIMKKRDEERRKIEEEKIQKMIKEGIPTHITLETIENQYGEEIESEYAYIDTDEMKCRYVRLNCYSSADVGLGTCQCISHPTWFDEEITPEYYLELVKKYASE